MTEQPSLLRAGIMSYVGLQLVLFGLLMLSLGILLGTLWVGEAAWAHLLNTSDAPMQMVTVPEYLRQASAINMWAVAVSVASLLGLIGLDYVGHDTQ